MKVYVPPRSQISSTTATIYRFGDHNIMPRIRVKRRKPKIKVKVKVRKKARRPKITIRRKSKA